MKLSLFYAVLVFSEARKTLRRERPVVVKDSASNLETVVSRGDSDENCGRYTGQRACCVSSADNFPLERCRKLPAVCQEHYRHGGAWVWKDQECYQATYNLLSEKRSAVLAEKSKFEEFETQKTQVYFLHDTMVD